jgi:Asp-tRNA(Asn)/Glu-tRNA(Gln) amidotransferase B subunit
VATTWEEIYQRFFNLIVQDKDFFQYNNIEEFEALEIAKSRAKNYLIDSIAQLTLSCTPQINFYDFNLTTEIFNFNCTNNEMYLLASLMKEHYFNEDLAKLKVWKVHFKTKELDTFSPANERKTFTDMCKDIIKENKKLIKDYMSRDRETGKLKMVGRSSVGQVTS